MTHVLLSAARHIVNVVPATQKKLHAAKLKDVILFNYY